MKNIAEETVNEVKTKFDNFELAEAAQCIVNLADTANKFVNDNAPWTLAKEGKTEECAKVLYNVLETMRYIAIILYPYCPNISQNIWQQLNSDGKIADFKLKNLHWGELKTGKIADKSTISPVFLRLDSEIAGDKKKC